MTAAEKVKAALAEANEARDGSGLERIALVSAVVWALVNIADAIRELRPAARPFESIAYGVEDRRS